jgi:hypothetical protein
LNAPVFVLTSATSSSLTSTVRSGSKGLGLSDAALGAKDLDASMALYQPDATLESPLVRHLLGVDDRDRARAREPARVRRGDGDSRRG